MHVIAGELIYQLRSTLDQIAVALARLSTGKTFPKETHYPCGDSLKGFKASCRTNLRGFDKAFVREIVRTRPYNGANEPLRAVFRMANIDKHMELIAIGAAGGISAISHFTVEYANIGFIVSGPGNLNEGVVFSDLGPRGVIRPNHPDAKIKVAGQITLGEISPYERKPLVPFMRAMIEEVRSVHARFEALTRRPPPPRTFTLSTKITF